MGSSTQLFTKDLSPEYRESIMFMDNRAQSPRSVVGSRRNSRSLLVVAPTISEERGEARTTDIALEPIRPAHSV